MILTTCVSRLLTQCTFEFNHTNYARVAQVLEGKAGISGTAALLDHFYFNKDWWRRHVRMTTPKRTEHAVEVKRLHVFVQKFIPTYNAKLADYFNNLEWEILEGLYNELSDINLYTWDGVDSDGLDIYTRRRGSNRAELYHRFLSLAFGPATMGPEMGHYLMLLVSYRFNISTGIARCNEYDFGHPWLEYIDRIQIRHIQLFGWNLFPRHKNLLLVETDPDFIVVGFGSISLDARYVQPSDRPAHDLKACIRWLASQMRVAEPALNVSSPFERKICNDFFKTFPKPTTRRFEELGKRFK